MILRLKLFILMLISLISIQCVNSMEFFTISPPPEPQFTSNLIPAASILGKAANNTITLQEFNESYHKNASLLNPMLLPGLPGGKKFTKMSQEKVVSTNQIYRNADENLTLAMGRSVAVIECQLNEHYLHKFELLQWVKDGFGLGYGNITNYYPRFKILKNETYGIFHLQINDIELGDDGVYSCQAPPNFSVKTTITVSKPPNKLYLDISKDELQPQFGQNTLSDIDSKISAKQVKVQDSVKKLHVIENQPVTIECNTLKARPPSNVSIYTDIYSLFDESTDLTAVENSKLNHSYKLLPDQFQSVHINQQQFGHLFKPVELYDTTTRYTFTPTAEMQGKHFQCETMYALGSSIYENHRAHHKYVINVLTKPKVNTVISRTQVKEHEYITITCQVIAANPHDIRNYYLVTGLKEYGSIAVLKHSKRNRFTHKATKNLKDLYCQAENEIGKSSVAYDESVNKITVFNGPYLIPNTQTTFKFRENIDQKIEINCADYFESVPTAALSPEKIVISEISSRNSGKYYCAATNNVTKKSERVEILIEIESKPVIETIENSLILTGSKRKQIQSICTYQSIPPPTAVIFTVNYLTDGSESEYEIQQQQTENENGNLNSASTPFPIRITPENNYSVRLAKNLNATNMTHVFDNIDPFRLYEIACTVENSYGSSMFDTKFDERKQFLNFQLFYIIILIISVLLTACVFGLIYHLIITKNCCQHTRGSVQINSNGLTPRRASNSNILPSESTLLDKENPSTSGERNQNFSGGSSSKNTNSNSYEFTPDKTAAPPGYNENEALLKISSEAQKKPNSPLRISNLPNFSNTLHPKHSSPNRALSNSSVTSSSNKSNTQISSTTNRDDGYYSDSKNHALPASIATTNELSRPRPNLLKPESIVSKTLKPSLINPETAASQPQTTPHRVNFVLVPPSLKALPNNLIFHNSTSPEDPESDTIYVDETQQKNRELFVSPPIFTPSTVSCSEISSQKVVHGYKNASLRPHPVVSKVPSFGKKLPENLPYPLQPASTLPLNLTQNGQYVTKFIDQNTPNSEYSVASSYSQGQVQTNQLDTPQSSIGLSGTHDRRAQQQNRRRSGLANLGPIEIKTDVQPMGFDRFSSNQSSLKHTHNQQTERPASKLVRNNLNNSSFYGQNKRYSVQKKAGLASQI